MTSQGAPPNSLAEHRQSTPADHSEDGRRTRAGGQALDYPGHPQPHRDPGATPRRPLARRSPDPRTQPTPPVPRLRHRREDRHPIRGLSTGPPEAGRRDPTLVLTRTHRWVRNKSGGGPARSEVCGQAHRRGPAGAAASGLDARESVRPFGLDMNSRLKLAAAAVTARLPGPHRAGSAHCPASEWLAGQA